MKLLKKIKRYWKAWKVTRISEEYVRTLSLYPNHPHKSLAQIRNELFWLCRNRKRGSWTMDDTISHYFNMGLERQGSDVRQYVFQVESVRARRRKQPKTAITLANKWVTTKYLQSCGIATTCPILYKTPFISSHEALDIIKRAKDNKFFAKLVDGIRGEGSFSFTKNNNEFKIDGETCSEEVLVAKLENCIVEPFIDQHEALNAIYPHAVASLRIVTVRNNNKIEIILRALFVGASGTRTSNLHQGGLRLPIDESGKLLEKGIRFNVQRGWYKCHPDTGLVFKGFQIPFWNEVVELVTRTHQCFPKIHSVGWDVAISKNGPLIIEGNHNWGTVSFQFTNGPGRDLLKKYLLS